MLPPSPSSLRQGPHTLLPAQGWAAHRYSQDQDVVFTQADQAVWDDHLEGMPAAAVARGLFLPLGRVKAILAAPPPPPLAQDPRLHTQRRALWIAPSGPTPFESSPGAAYPFLLVFLPLRFPQSFFRRAMRAIGHDIRTRHGLDVAVGHLNERLPFAAAHRFATLRGVPCWTFDEGGAFVLGPPAWTPPDVATA